MSKYWLLDFNSILDDHLASPQVKDLTRDSGTTTSTRSEELSAYSFYDSIFDNGGGHYSKMKSAHIIYNLKKDDYDYHYDDISDYTTTTTSRDLSTSFNGGRYCIMMESNDDRSAMYDFFDEKGAVRDTNYGFGVTTRSGWGHWLQFLRPQSYAFSFEEQTKPTDGFTDAQYWGFKDFKIIAQTDSNNKTQNVFFMIDSKVIFEFPIDSTNYFYVLNTKSWWDEITDSKFKNVLGIQTFYIKPKSSGFSTYDDFSRPTSIEFSDDNGTTWKKIGGSFPSRKKPDGTAVPTADYDKTVSALNSRYDTSSQMKSSHSMNYNTASRYRDQLNIWGIPWTNTTNGSAATDITDDDYSTIFINNAPILLYSMNITNGRTITETIKYHYVDVYGLPKNATNIKFWTGDDRQRYSIEINGTSLGDFDMWDPYFHMKEASLDGVTLNGKEDLWSNKTTTGMQSGYNPVSYSSTPVYYNNSMYFFGRRQSSSNYAEMWKLDIATSTWSKLTTTGTIVATQGHTTILYNDCLYIFGGKNNSGNYTNNTYKFDLSTDTFSQITTSGTAPGIRYQHAACLNGTEMIISGGHNGTTLLNSTFKLDLTTDTWSEISTTGSDMAKRNGHTIFMYNQQIYIIGGDSNVTDGDNGNICDNIYTLDLTTNAWSHLSTLGSFTGSYYASTNVIGNNVLIFGGYTSTNTTGLDQFYIFSLTGNSFTDLTIVEGKPTTDWGTLSVFDSVNGKIHYYGGNGGNNQQKLYTYNFAYPSSGMGGGSSGYVGTLDQTIYRELDHMSNVNIISSAGNKFVFNNYSTYIPNMAYDLNIGTFHLKNIPQSHPIALLNNGKEDKISYKGLITKKITKTVTGTEADADYDFYWGDVTINVHNSFSKCSVYCYHHGYMGGQDIFNFNSKMIDNNTSTTEYGIYQTHQSWAMLKTNGTVFIWGPNYYGAASNLSFESKLKKVKKIYPNYYTFCILLEDGTAFPFGSYGDQSYGQLDFPSSNTSIIPQLTNIKKIFHTGYVFVALKYDNSVVVWGENSSSRWNGYMDISNNLTDVIDAVGNPYSMCFLKNDNTAITIGRAAEGGEGSTTQNLINVKKVYSARNSYAALHYDGTVTCWGNSTYGGDSSNVDNLVEIIDIFTTGYAYCALNKDKSIVATWGHNSYGASITQSSSGLFDIDDLTNIKNIYATENQFIVENYSNTVYTWGGRGQHIYNDISLVAHNNNAWALIKTDGTVVAGGNGTYGGSIPTDKQPLLTNVVQIYATDYTFTALKDDNSIVWWGVGGNYPGTDTLMYTAETNDDNAVEVETDVSLNVVDVFPGRHTIYIEKQDGYFYRINDFTFNGNNSAENDYDQSHKIGSRINRYSNMNPNYRQNHHGPLLTNSNSLTTNKYFDKYSVSEIKREFYRLNYTDASQNIFNNAFTNNILNDDVKQFIKNEITNETNIILKNDKRKIFTKTLLKNNSKDKLLLETSDLDISDIVSKKYIEIFKNSSTIDLTIRNAENSIFCEFDKNEHIIIKSKNGKFILYKSADLVEKYYIIEYEDSLSNIVFTKITGCKNFNFTNNTGYLIENDIFEIDQYKFKVGSLIDVTDITTLVEIKVKKIFSNDGAFVTLKNNGYIDCWGKSSHGGTPPTDISNVKNIFTTSDTFTALLTNNNLITWGNTNDNNPVYVNNKNFRKIKLLNKVKSLSGNINNASSNNTKILKKYNYKNNSIQLDPLQVTDIKVLHFINTFGEDLYKKVEKINIVNNELNTNDLDSFQISTNKKRNAFFDGFFMNSGNKNIIVDTERIYLQNKILKNKTLIIEQNVNTMDVRKNSTQINKDKGVYSSLTDLSDNVIVELDNNIKFKVTRTTNYLTSGKYILEPIIGTIKVYGRHNGSITNQGEVLGLFEDDDEVYINNLNFFFGGFGTNGVNLSEKNKYNSVVSHTYGFAYIDASGAMQTLASGASRGDDLFSTTYGISRCTGKDIDHTKDIVHIVANHESFAALTKNGEVLCTGHPTYCSMNAYYDWQKSVVHLNNEIIQIYSNYYFYVALKKNRDLFAWGYIDIDDNSVPQIMTHTSISSSYMGKQYQKQPVISPIKNVHEVIMGWHSCAVITLDRKLITFGLASRGGDYLDETYGINGTVNSMDDSGVRTSVLTNVKKVVSTSNGFAALDYNGKVYIWGYSAISNRDISLNSGVKDIQSFYNGFLAIYEDYVQPYAVSHNSYHCANFNQIANDVSQNCVMHNSFYALAFLRKTDNKVFICGHAYGGYFHNNSYFKGDRKDIVGSYQMNNVRELYAATYGFAVIKTDGSVQSWGYDTNTYHMNIGTTYGGHLDSNVKKLFSNGYSWCALKEDGTIVTWSNPVGTYNVSNQSFATGCNFLDIEYGINSTKFGGNGGGGSRVNSFFNNEKIGFIKKVFPIKRLGFIALYDNDGEEKIYIWGNCFRNITVEELNSFNNYSETCNLDITNSYNSICHWEGGYQQNLINNIEKDDLFLPYKKIIDVKVETINGNNKFVLNNDPSNNPLTNKDLNYEFDLSDDSLSSHPFIITSTPYSNNSIWKRFGTDGNKYSNYDALLSNKYNIIRCQTHGVGMGSLYNDPNIIVDISEGEVVQSLYNENIKTTIGSYTILNYNHNIIDASLNIVTFTNYEERSAIFNLIKKVIAFKLSSIKVSKIGLDLTNSDFNFNNPILFNNNAFVFDSNTVINFPYFNKENNFYFGNLINKNEKITIEIDSNNIFSIEKITLPENSDKYKINFIKGILEFRTRSPTYHLENNFTVVNQNTTFDESTYYFIKDDTFFINDIEFKLVGNGFITSGIKINYKEIILTKDSNGNYLYNGKYIKPSFEYGINYKLIDNISDNYNAPLIITKNVF